MQSSAEQLSKTMLLLYKNIFNLLVGFQTASSSQNSSVNVIIEKEDGTSETVVINSFQSLQKELTRIDENYKSLINGDNLSYTLEKDGSISQQTKTSFINAEYLENFVVSENCIIDKTSNLKDLIFPNVKIPITINSQLRSDVYCKVFEITNGWENIKDNPTILDLQYLANNVGSISYEEINRSLKLEKNQIKYFGKFSVLSVVQDSTSNNTFTVTLDDIKYSGLYTNGSSIDLKVNDILVSKTGSSKYIVESIDKITKTLKITRIAGSENLFVGVNNLYFNEILPNDDFIVGVPVRPNQKIVVFLSTENFKNISYPSNGIKIDTSNYKVVYNNTTYTLDEFFGLYVTNFSEYLMAFIDETAIPASLGIIPNKPVLNPANFKVIQINKHLSNSKNVTEINELNKRKKALQNEIDFKQKQIDNYQKQLDTQTFKSTEEKNYKISQINGLKLEINALKTNILTIAQDIDSDAIKYGLKNIVPKYKLIGFWPIQSAIISSQTANQNIIKYEILYRYLSKDSDTVDNTSYSMIDDNNNSVTVAFSPWNEAPSATLSKVKNDNGEWVWETQATDSVEQININQCAIAINDGESVEIKIRAVSEAGYPLAPIKSEWSEILRVDFPTELSASTISSTINQNSLDLTKAEMDALLTNYGLLSHIAGQIQEAEKLFLHNAKDVTSGQYTNEQKNIPLDVCIANIISRLKTLENVNTTNTVNISLIDFNGETFSVTNNTTMELFGGNYTDSVNLLDQTKWGAIIRKKGYIKIKNNNIVPIELKSLVPGTIFSSVTAPQYYNVPVKNVDSLLQKSKQIAFFRNVDLTGQSTDLFKLVTTKLADTTTVPPDIDTTAIDSAKNIIYFDPDANEVKTCKLKSVYSTLFAGFSITHPLYNVSDLTPMRAELDRIKKYTANLKALQYQDEIANSLGFADNDFYAIGQYTCGAFLYPVISNVNSISVVGDTTISTLIIPKESELLIPFIFEYRMMDKMGHINGLINQDSNTPLVYSKKIGLDILLPDNNIFKFDINCTAKLKSKVTTGDSSTVSSVISSFTGESPSNLT